MSSSISDRDRLDFLADFVNAFAEVAKDLTDHACDVADAAGRVEPTREDVLVGFRRLIDEAMENKR